MAQGRRGRAGKEGRADAAGAPPVPPRSAPPPPICQVPFCPICMTVTALGEIKPEVMEHLLLAGREMLLAFRAVIDAHLESTPADSKPKLERLKIE